MTALLDETLRRLDDCGCCAGIGPSVPGVVFNRPGLSAIAYRSATWHEFRSSLIAALSHRDHPALASLTTRDGDDFTIAFLDAVAAMGDVLTFYGERIATESYLRTATERRSILELARLIGYELKPGVAASTLVAFTVEDPPVPVGEALAPRVAVVDVGVKVQSIPGHEEKPQTFETVERIEARAEWNTLRPRLVGPQVIAGSPASLTLAGTDTKLQPGDTVLLVSGLPGSNVADSNWEARRIAGVSTDFTASRTTVALDPGSAKSAFAPSGPVQAYAMRTRAAAFGYNAADWKTLSASFKKAYLGKANSYTLTEDDLKEWPAFGQVFTADVIDATISASLDLEAVHPVSSGTWAVLSTPSASHLFTVSSTLETGLTRFAISGRVTRVALDGSGFTAFEEMRRDLVVHAQSDALDPGGRRDRPAGHGRQRGDRARPRRDGAAGRSHAPAGRHGRDDPRDGVRGGHPRSCRVGRRREHARPDDRPGPQLRAGIACHPRQRRARHPRRVGRRGAGRRQRRRGRSNASRSASRRSPTSATSTPKAVPRRPSVSG